MALGLTVPAFAVAASLTAIVWPSVAVALALLLVIAGLALRFPAYALLSSLLLLALEGTTKLRFTLDGVPSPLTLGAGVSDLAFAFGLAGLLLHDRGQRLRALWQAMITPERVVVLLLGTWLVLSLPQALQGDLSGSLGGLRLFQFYVIAVLAGALLTTRLSERRLAQVILWLGGAVAAYAALRAVIGPSDAERAFTFDRSGQARLGTVARDTGTFSSPFGLVSFIAPLGAFALATAYLDRRLRGLAIGVFALVSVGIIGSYVRFGFIAVVLGAAFFVFVLLAGRGTNRRTKLLSVGLIAAILLAGFAATLAAGTVSNTAKERAEALTNPFSDPSAKVRFRRWDYASEYIVKHPLGAGLGAVDPDERRVPGEAPTFTDNSYLTVLVEQGVVGLLFIVGILGACFFTARRLARAGPTQHPLGVAALTGFVAFLALCFSAEYLEQPGKALAWTMLGIAVAGALAPGPVAPSSATRPRA